MLWCDIMKINGELKKKNIKISYTYFPRQMSAVRDKKENLKERNENLLEGEKSDKSPIIYWNWGQVLKICVGS